MVSPESEGCRTDELTLTAWTRSSDSRRTLWLRWLRHFRRPMRGAISAERKRPRLALSPLMNANERTVWQIIRQRSAATRRGRRLSQRHDHPQLEIEQSRSSTIAAGAGSGVTIRRGEGPGYENDCQPLLRNPTEKGEWKTTGRSYPDTNHPACFFELAACSSKVALHAHCWRYRSVRASQGGVSDAR